MCLTGQLRDLNVGTLIYHTGKFGATAYKWCSLKWAKLVKQGYFNFHDWAIEGS
jgi:hypothetical protein